MQGLHHQQQQLAALLSVALGKDDSSATAAATTTATASSTTVASTTIASSSLPPASQGTDESTRLGAINSLHRLIVYPPNSVLVSHSASFLFQGFSQLLTDKLYSVRRSAATAYGALCSMICTISLGSNGRQNHVVLSTLVDRFINWALPLLSNVTTDGSMELALESLREFLSVGDVGATERYAFPILKACQELLEDERTSSNLLHQILGVLTVISLKYFRCFQPHFADVVDLLLGWAMLPDLAESDRQVIMGSFLQFQKYWVSNLRFPLGLLSKFLGDMDMLLQDGSPGSPQQYRRLLALLYCFSTVLKSTASGLLEINLLEQIVEPLSKMIPKLLGCLSMMGKIYGWSKWIEDSWKCLTLLAEILGEKFAVFYPLALDVLFTSLNVNDNAVTPGGGIITSYQIHGVLKTNLQLLSLQKLGLLPSSVRKILQWDASISQLRLHPNHLVVASAAATYVFLLQHGNDEVVEHSINSLFGEMTMLVDMLEKILVGKNVDNYYLGADSYSKAELLALIKFNLKVMLSCISLDKVDSFVDSPDMLSLVLRRSECLSSFVIAKLYSRQLSVQSCVELQVIILETLSRISSAELWSKYVIEFCRKDSFQKTRKDGRDHNIIVEHLSKYSSILVKAVEFDSSLVVKVKALEWIHKLCEDATRIYRRLNIHVTPCDDAGYGSAVWSLVSSILSASFDRETEVRLQVAVVFDKLLLARLVHPRKFYKMAELVLEKLGDPDATIRSAFVKRLSFFLPVTIYLCDLSDCGTIATGGRACCKTGDIADLHWRRVFALKQLPQRLQPQQLVSILSYISQRWKAPLSSWVQRLIQQCNCAKDLTQSHLEETGSSNGNSIWMNMKFDNDVLERTSLVNYISGIWWAIQEAARYCTATRLRTNLGGPTQTFAALERMLLDVAHMLQIDSEQNDGGLSIIGSSGAHLLPMRLLLDFVEALKKNVYNAYEGSSVLPCASRQSSLFFKANKKVCEEWFSRISEPMMNAGLALQCHDAIIEYCSLRLQELKNSMASSLREKSRNHLAENLHNIRKRLTKDVMRTAQHMALALSKKHESAALVGLQKWLDVSFSSLFDDWKQVGTSYHISEPFSWITGLIHEAEGQYEKAAAVFTHLLETEEYLSSIGADGIQFIIGRVIESYCAISNWQSLDSWLMELQALRTKHAGKSYSGALTTTGNEMNAIHALAHFDEGDYQAAWASLDLTPKSSSELTLDPKLALQRSELMLLQALLYKNEDKMDKVPPEIQKAKLMLDEVLTVLSLDGLPEAAPYAIHLHSIYALEEDCRFGKIQEKLKPSESVFNSLCQAVYLPMNVVRQDCSSWLKLLRVYKTILPTSSVTLQLCKNLMSLARKQGNLGLANHLKKYLRDQVDDCLEASNHIFLSSSLNYEEILLMYAEKKFADAIFNMWSYIKSSFISVEFVNSSADDSPLKARACLKFSNWLRLDYADLSLENVVQNILSDFSQCGGNNEFVLKEKLSSKPSMHSVIQEFIGAATKLSTQLCPTMGKSWIAYASWCFSQAKESLCPSQEAVLNSCSYSPVLGQQLVSKIPNLTDDEMSRVGSIISEILRANVSPEGEDNESSNNAKNLNHTNSLVQKVVKVIEVAAGALGAEDFGAESLPTVVSSQLRMIFLDQNFLIEDNAILSSVNALVDIWWSLRKRRVSLYGHAAQGYIQYLSHSSSKLGGFASTARDCESFSQKTGSLILRATLYILHILLNYGVELQDTLEPALSAVPLLPWQEVTPQVFARLCAHPEPAIRRQLESLLMMLAKSSPWSVVYPTLVDVNASDEEPPVELKRILDCLVTRYPKLVQDVKLMINELGNVTVLWEELWLSTLQDLHGDVLRRINLLKEEAARISENITLSHSEKAKINAAKYSAMMAPIVVALERRYGMITRKPETPHEKWFQDEYKEPIKSAILAFKTPPASASALGDVWRPFDNIAASLASYQRKSAVSLNEVAPQLARLSSSDVPMPGFEKQVMLSESDRDLSSASVGIVTIASFSEQVAILPTKTKPKKLVILGSDGGNYTYLLKGREDLRLDARIMQLLQAINKFLHSYAETRSQSVGIRYYSVTPISGRAGLIQWVDNVVSIYSIFKSWQQRVQAAQLLATAGGNVKNSVPVPRPSDMFYGKIIPALKEKGIKRVISRKDWPHEVKLKVLLDLMKETPRQLLHQEIWCASESFNAFNSKLKRYSGSLAAMSMVGHILGLGDRHLDNILIDFFSGDIVHIDYNVCFEKGRRLKVPEIVPFRLTQTLEAALGLTGLEGDFRANCEAVIGVLRRNKDLLLMLLEVFVWDPLVEWTRGDFHDDAAIGGEERKGMELAVSLSLFASRVQEMRVPLQEHHDLLLASAPSVGSSFERFLNILNQYELVSAVYYRADQERSTFLHHETSAKSLVAEANSRSEKARAFYEVQAREFAQAKAAVAEKVQEATTWLEQHGRFLDALRNDAISEIKVSLKLTCMEEALSLTSAVSVAGVPLSIVPEPTQAQCHEIDREISQLMAEMDNGISCAVTALQTYALALRRFLPLNYIATSPVHTWAQVLQLSVNTLSPDVLSLARRQAGELVSKIHGDAPDFVRHRWDDLCLQLKRYALEIEKLEEEYAGLVNTIGSEAESKAKDRLMYSFLENLQSSNPGSSEESFPCLPHKHFNYEGVKATKVQDDMISRKMFVLYEALCSVYDEVKHKILNFCNTLANDEGVGSLPSFDFGTIFSELEEQIEKCVLVVDLVIELQHAIGDKASTVDIKLSSNNWVAVFKTTLLSCKEVVVQMSEGILPKLIKSIVSIDSEVMDAFGAMSNIRGSVETALEQLVEVEVEKISLEELERSYFVKVGFITEQQLALEEAAMRGRDHLSWEEAEELASQEEACRAQLDQLHHTWSQKDARSSSLIKKEADIRDGLLASEHHYQSLLGSVEEGMITGFRSNVLLSTLDKPFAGLDSLDKALLRLQGFESCQNDITKLAKLLTSGMQMYEYIWNFKGLLNGLEFFAWKVAVMDSVLDLTIHDVSSSIDQNLGMDQLVDGIQKKLVTQFQVVMSLYIKERIVPALVHCLDREAKSLKQQLEGSREIGLERLQKDINVDKKMKVMIEEYCGAHETVRAARSAASCLRRQVNELKEATKRTSLEIIQTEWLYDNTLAPSHDSRSIAQNFLDNDDKMYHLVLDIKRPNLLESIQSAVSKIASSIECLQSCERTSVAAEGQLERAMNWACGGPNSGTTGNSYKSTGIPSEFHDHLNERRKLVQEAREIATGIMRACLSVLEVEASREGILCLQGDLFPFRTSGDGRTWQQAYLNILTRLEVAFHSFSRAEQELKLAKNSMEAASNGLSSASDELSVASLKAKSASEDLQTILLQMRDCACEVSVSLSAFCRVAKGHTALTSECGSMLEEVLAISDDLHDVHNLGKEAAAMHNSLMESITKASEIIFPLESVLSKDVAAMTDAMAKERETKMEISPLHGQAIYQSYYPKIKEAFQAFMPLVPNLVSSVKELHSSLTKLAQSASLHATKLHEAVEGSPEARSEDLNLSREDLPDSYPEYDDMDGVASDERDGEEDQTFVGANLLSEEDKGWLSPPDSIYSGSSGGVCVSGEPSLVNGFDFQEALEDLSISSNNKDDEGEKEQLFITDTGQLDILHVGMSSEERKDDGAGLLLDVQPENALPCTIEKEYLTLNLEGNDGATSSKKVRAGDDTQNDRLKKDGVRSMRGKNAFALSVLRRIEMKLDGRDISEKRELSAAEQVDYLLKQATSADNLCNMYEGWTPWI